MSHIESIKQLPALKHDDFKHLQQFVEGLNAAVAALGMSCLANEIQSTSLVSQVLEKLLLRLRREWEAS